MATEIRVPTLGESVTEATIGRWFKKAGEAVAVDEPLVELETDKVTVEVPAPVAGVLSEIKAKDGDTVAVGALLGSIAEGAGGKAAAKAAPAKATAETAKPAASAPAKPAAAAPAVKKVSGDGPQPPAVRRLAAETGVDPAAVAGSGKDGRVTKGDMLAAIAAGPSIAPPTPPIARGPSPPDDATREERVRITKLRQTSARRLKDAQNTAAMLTTSNDVDMSAVMAMRARYKETFEKKHAVKLGFMGFFVKACIQALKEIPAVNGEADQLSSAEIEKKIADFGRRARDGHLTIDEMQGGTFTISNGGIYGSLLSTPILNAPQSGILGMHRIEERPVAVKGQVVIKPMMYLALSYDHRVVDGQQAVTFLVRVKESLEDPARLVLDL